MLVKLCICFEICPSSKWFCLELTFLFSWADNSSTNQYSYQLFYSWGMTHLVPSYLKNAYYGRGVGETPSGLSYLIQFSSVQLLSRVWLFATPWITECQASLSITNPRSSPKLMYIELVMPFSFCRSQQTVEISSRGGNTRPPDLPPEKSVCRSRSNS